MYLVELSAERSPLRALTNTRINGSGIRLGLRFEGKTCNGSDRPSVGDLNKDIVSSKNPLVVSIDEYPAYKPCHVYVDMLSFTSLQTCQKPITSKETLTGIIDINRTTKDKKEKGA